ncbi:MAG: 2-oxo acid dehydrogenase subunit E2 [Bacteroidetes bacterium]|nr:2-oxo acid dehydrogenase subunit E2 [Bacteroidota bacterium]
MEKKIVLPKISDNINVVTVTEILVKVGDKVEAEDSLITVESEKASLEVPTEFEGVIKEILVKEGEEVKIGATIVILDTDEEEAKKEQSDVPKEVQESSKEKEPEVKDKDEDEVKDTDQKESEISSEEKQEANISASESSIAESGDSTDKSIPVSPLARKVAREMGVNLQELVKKSDGGRITVDDVKQFAQTATSSETKSLSIAAIPIPDFSQWGETKREKLSSINKITAKNTTFSWQTMPHVTHFDNADITELEEFRKKYNARHQSGITITSILLKIIGIALKQFPKFNASLDANNNELIYKHYYHIGVAADTKDGLLMPVIQHVDQKGITEMSQELGDLAEKARNRKLHPDQMQGQTFVISNLGGIGGVGFTPVVFPNNSAILGVSRASVQPVWDKEKSEFKPRLIAPLSLSYDHRVIDGADAARFMRWVCEGLERPIQLLF